LSQGTPVDPTPQFIQKVLAESANAPGYPLTAGTPELREAIAQWARTKLGASGEFDVLPVIGSKELVAWLPTLLESKNVIYPEIAYPTYKVGAIIAGASHSAVAIDPATWPKADLAWLNSPSNPTGRVHSESELAKVLQWSRSTGSIVASDECYLEFGYSQQPVSLLKVAAGDNKNLIAVHSLSKRSSIAGYRAAFIVGDAALISRIREIRKHAGMLVPLPVQKAMVAALADSVHVVEQAARYNARRDALAPALAQCGFEISDSGAGLYIWCTRNESDWDSVSWLADRGIIATPGSFYGELGSRHIRVALTAADAKIADAVERLK
jgi:succinyldiaminopimelate transaminase